MKPLDSLAKRDLLAAKRFNPEKVRQHAEDFLAQGRLGDAFEFFRKLDDRDGVERTLHRAIATSDTDVLWRTEKRYPDLAKAEQWRECGERAMADGKYRAAAYAFAHIGDAERQRAAEREFMPQEEPAASETSSRRE
jgi:hypothetical protein